jgi:tellurite resistance-related uncharacterized protein
MRNVNRELPTGCDAYRRTAIFTEKTVPTALRHGHRTKPGVWGAITVIEGRLRLRRLDPPDESVLAPSAPGIVAPEEEHEVEPLGPVRFFVEFYAIPA